MEAQNPDMKKTISLKKERLGSAIQSNSDFKSLYIQANVWQDVLNIITNLTDFRKKELIEHLKKHKSLFGLDAREEFFLQQLVAYLNYKEISNSISTEGL